MSKDPEKRYQALLAGDLSDKELEEMRRELKSDVNELKKFVESRDLDLTEDEIFNAFRFAIPSKSRIESLSNTEADEIYRKILPSIETTQISQPQSFLRRLKLSPGVSFFIGAAVASLVILAFPLFLSPDDQVELKEGITEKQPAERIRLVFNIGKREKGRPIVIERGVPGEKYGVENDVLIRYEIKKSGYVCLAHYLPSGKLDVLDDSRELLKPGWYDMKKSGRVKAVALNGLPGKHSFYGVFSTSPIECPQVAHKILKGLYGSDTIVDSFSIEVE
jgi:hypothetical protein